MLLVLLLKVFQFTNQLFLPATEVVWSETFIVVVHCRDMQYDIQELLLASKMVLVARVGDLVLNTIDLNRVLWYTEEDHSTEDGLFIC